DEALLEVYATLLQQVRRTDVEGYIALTSARIGPQLAQFEIATGSPPHLAVDMDLHVGRGQLRLANLVQVDEFEDHALLEVHPHERFPGDVAGVFHTCGLSDVDTVGIMQSWEMLETWLPDDLGPALVAVMGVDGWARG